MLCANGHNNTTDARYCETCGVNVFQPHSVVVQRPTNGMAVASLVLGILWVYWIGSILAVIFAYIARRQLKTRDEAGKGLATAGLALGWVGVGILLILIVAFIITAARSGT